MSRKTLSTVVLVLIAIGLALAQSGDSLVYYRVSYDSILNLYIITPYVDSFPAGNPLYLTPQEYLEWREEQLRTRYVRQLEEEISESEEDVLPSLPPIDESIRRVFGTELIHIKPSGELSFTAGFRHTRVDNPLIPEPYRSYGHPDFDVDMRFNIVGSIGNVVNLNFNFDTRAQFDFQNKLKLKYEGKEHHIIKSIEAGNISFGLPTTLVTGVQNLMGIKTTLQFGRLTLSAVVAEQRSESQTITLQGGAQYRTVEIRAHEYDENKHFFLAHPFRDNFEQALSSPPVIKSPFRITRIEVWITNRTNRPENARDIVALADLGEPNPYRTSFQLPSPPPVPSNSANTLYQAIANNPAARNSYQVVGVLQSMGLKPSVDFEKVYARRLSEQEYTLHPELGFISLHITLQPDEVLAVAFEFTYNGRTYKVGEFSDEVPPGTEGNQVLFVKMLKSTTTRTDIPLWDLMMKNVYSIRAWQIDGEDFRVDIFYQDAEGNYKRYIPEGSLQGIPLIQVLGLDRLDKQGRQIPDGIFDFLPGITIIPERGWLIFPVLEPFGSALQEKMVSEPYLWGKYVFQELYDSTKVQAMKYPAKNRYVIRVRYKSKGAQNEIDLGRINIPPGSVKVIAGGRVLQEGKDYTVDYMLGKVRIINPAILESGQPIQVSFESQDFVAFQRKLFLGVRADYWINDNLSIGATWLRLSELPFTPKVDYYSIPYTNEIFGVDLNYQTQSFFLTHLINKLPTVESKTPSSVQFQLEVAHFVPKEARALRFEDKRKATIFLDDFEGARQYYDLRLPVTAWQLASPPHQWYSYTGVRIFPETDSINTLAANKNRALLSWYTIDPVFYQNTGRTPDYIKQDPKYISDPYTHEVLEQEVFPERESPYGTPVILQTLDLAYYPQERGPYNYTTAFTADGRLTNPSYKWAGIQQALFVTDFERSNIEYIEFWLMDPFIHNPFSTGGELYIHLGNISEDILPDGRMSYENGLPRDPLAEPEKIDTTVWGIVPSTPPVTYTFDNDPETRTAQDVGLDGLSDEHELTFFQSWLSQVQTIVNAQVYQRIQQDPSGDNFIHYLDPVWDDLRADIITRYKYYSMPEGNSPVATAGTDIILASTNNPNSEDMNRDNTLNQTEHYFQYVVHLKPSQMQVGKNFITDVVEATVPMPDGSIQKIKWYQFRIPVRKYSRKVGNPDWRSIRFIRLLLTGFDTTVILRFARVALVGSTWRIYDNTLQEPGEVVPIDDVEEAELTVGVVNIEENSQRKPVPYVLPPNIERERLPSGFSGNLVLQNEQSLSLKVCNLADGDRKAVYRNLNFDLRQFERLKMFIHAEATSEDPALTDGKLYAFIRLGTDFKNNYYEIQVPLVLTPWGSSDPSIIWPSRNQVNILLDSLVAIKRMRDIEGVSPSTPFVYVFSNGHRVIVKGKPDLGRVEAIMLGVYNPPDDGLAHCVEVWFNELRVYGLKNYGGTAFRASTSINMAGMIQLGASLTGRTPGFGLINQSITERSQDYFLAADFSVNMPLNQLLGISRLSLPVYATYSIQRSIPKYHPFETDVEVKELLRGLSKREKDSLRRSIQTITVHKGISLTGIKWNGAGRAPWALSNWTFGASYQEQTYRDPYTLIKLKKIYSLEATYSYSPGIKPWEPFKYRIKPGKQWLAWLRDFNIKPAPDNFTWRNQWNRRFELEQLRPLTENELPLPPYYSKEFLWIRQNSLKWNLTRSISLSFQNLARAVILEPPGEVSTPESRQQVANSIKKLGDIVTYQHSISGRYNLPFSKIPGLKWISTTIQYDGGMQWSTFAPAATSPDIDYATLQNSRKVTINTSFKLQEFHKGLHKTYWRIKYLLEPPPSYVKSLQLWRRKMELWKRKKKKGIDPGPKPQKPPLPPPPTRPRTTHGRFIQQFFSGLRTIRITFTRDERTIIPGYKPEPRWIGMDSSFIAPGIPFILGYQPDTSFLTYMARNGWITADTLLALPFEQHRTDRISATANFNFFRGISVSLDASYSWQQVYQEIFKDTVGDGKHFAHLSPYVTGNASISVIAFGSFLTDRMDRKTYRSRSINRVIEYTKIISRRLGEANPYSSGPIDTLPQYWEGYGPTSPQVLIPAFVAAYLGKDPERINPKSFFPVVPLPGWTVNIQVLHRLPLLKNWLRSSSIRHSYKATYAVGSFKTSFYYQSINGFDYAINPITGNFYPPYEFTGVRLEERFSPLLAVTLGFKRGVSITFQANRFRTLNLNFANYRIDEMLRKDYSLTISGGFKKLWLPRFLIPKRKRGPGKGMWITLPQKIQFSIRGSYGYNIQITHDLYRNLSLPTTGSISIRFSPSATYTPIKNLRIRAFMEYNKTIPLTSLGYPIRTFFIGATATYTLQ